MGVYQLMKSPSSAASQPCRMSLTLSALATSRQQHTKTTPNFITFTNLNYLSRGASPRHIHDAVWNLVLAWPRIVVWSSLRSLACPEPKRWSCCLGSFVSVRPWPRNDLDGRGVLTHFGACSNFDFTASFLGQSVARFVGAGPRHLLVVFVTLLASESVLVSSRLALVFICTWTRVGKNRTQRPPGSRAHSPRRRLASGLFLTELVGASSRCGNFVGVELAHTRRSAKSVSRLGSSVRVLILVVSWARRVTSSG